MSTQPSLSEDIWENALSLAWLQGLSDPPQVMKLLTWMSLVISLELRSCPCEMRRLDRMLSVNSDILQV